jgi:uncharacterized caspase-like protein
MQTVLLSVGISQYQSDKIRDLSVCHKDAQAVAAAFAKIAGDALEQRLLIDTQATKRGIQDGIAWLAETVKQGDLAVFFYSGHGASDKDDGGDEPDGTEEFICPYDCGMQPGLASFIRDDELNRWLSAVRQKTDRLAIIFDSCHSGTAVMAAQKATPKEIPPGIVRALIGDDKPPEQGAGTSAQVRGQLLLAGCRDNELSYILKNASNSLLTTYLLQVLEKPEITTFQELYQHVAQLVMDQIEQLGLQQNPNIVDGTGGKLTFR